MSGNASSPPASSQPYWHFCTLAPAHGCIRITLWHANDSGSHNSMQSIEHCTGCSTKLYAVRECCTVCNTHAERSCSAMAEWMMFKVDIWNDDSLSRANFFRLGNCINTGVQQDSFPAAVLSGQICASKAYVQSIVSSSSTLYTFVIA